MKKILALFLGMGLMTSAITSCGSLMSEQPDDSSITGSDQSDLSGDSSEYEIRNDLEDYRIGISVKNLRGSYMKVFRLTIVKKLKKLGFKESNILIYENNGDNELELKMIDLMIDSGVRQMLVCPNETSDIAAITDKVAGAGIPLIYFNCLPDETERARWTENERNWNVTCIGADKTQVGTLQAVLTSSFDMEQVDMNKNGYIDYVLIEGAEDSPLTEIYRNSFEEKLKEDDVPIRCLDARYANWDREEAYAIMQEDLASFGTDVELVICQNDVMALGAMLAIQEADRIVSSDIYLIGADCDAEAVENILKATMTGSVFNDGSLQATASITNLMNNIDGLKNEQVTDMEYVLVTAANAESIGGIIRHPV